MTPQRFRRIERLAQAVLQQTSADRASFLDAECSGDHELRTEVDRLLESYGQVESFLEVPAIVSADDHTQPIGFPDELRDRQIGPYEVLREIGRGGMGTVYLASRRGDYHRKVAIKLLTSGMNTEMVVRRFRSERQILSNLDHPHIAKLFEGGTTDDGRPYFVMEHIDGVPLNVFCDQNRLSIHDRLRLFLKVCSAVQYAHQNLVVHRDLKPSNILVTAAGEPKLLDFGIAKILDPEAFPLTVEVTETGLRPMTPHYASPEQIAGLAITTASDVYSLGVLLYELLAGRRPHQFVGLSPGEMERVLEGDPVKPSTALSELSQALEEVGRETLSAHRDADIAGLNRQLKGDLDNIVLMALRREPERRYPSANHLSEDVRRHLDGRPVMARQDHFGYRFGKFLRRNKLAVATTLTIAVSIIGAAVGMGLQAAQIARQRDIARIERQQAEIERDKARRVSDFLVEIFEVSDPNSALDADIKAREVLDRAAESIGEKLPDQPEIAAALRHALGRVYLNLGLYNQSRPLLEEALRLREETLGSEHRDVASTLHFLAMAVSQLDETQLARSLTERALEIRRTAFGENHPLVAESLILLSKPLHEQEDTAAAIAATERAIAILEQVEEEATPRLARAYQRLGFYLSTSADYELAARMLVKSISICEQVFGPMHPQLATTSNSLANVYLLAGDYSRAEPFYLRALEINRKALGDEHPRVATNLLNLGIVYRKRGDYVQAESALLDALARYQKIYGDKSRRVLGPLNSLAILAYYRGELVKAESYFQRGIEVVRETRRPNHPLMAFMLNNLGLVYRDQGRGEAEAALLQSIEIRQGIKNRDLVDDTRNNLASFYFLEGRTSEAETLYRSVLEASRQRLEEDPGSRGPRTVLAAANLGLGKLYQARGDDARAIESWQRAVELMAPLTAEPGSLELLDTHVVALLYLGRIEEARPMVEELASKNWLGADFLRLCHQLGLSCTGRQASSESS